MLPSALMNSKGFMFDFNVAGTVLNSHFLQQEEIKFQNFQRPINLDFTMHF